MNDYGILMRGDAQPVLTEFALLSPALICFCSASFFLADWMKKASTADRLKKYIHLVEAAG